MQPAPGGQKFLLVSVNGISPELCLRFVWDIGRKAPERGQQQRRCLVLRGLGRNLLRHQVDDHARLDEPALGGFVQQCDAPVHVRGNAAKPRDDVLVIAYRAAGHAVYGQVYPVMQPEQLIHAQEVRFKVIRLQVLAEFISKQTRAQPVLAGESDKRETVEFPETSLDVRPAPLAAGLRPIRPPVVIVVAADCRGELRLVAEPFFKELGEEFVQRLRPGLRGCRGGQKQQKRDDDAKRIRYSDLHFEFRAVTQCSTQRGLAFLGAGFFSGTDTEVGPSKPRGIRA